MRPRSQWFQDVCILHLQDCEVTAADAKAAINIYGQNLGAIKGKTVWHPNPHVKAGVDPVPERILKLHGDIALAADIMSVNKIPFLVTLSRCLKFGTIESLPNRCLPL
mmetsp:Transcript_16222/g.24509  ORF Transcript_16222/g.24509 Transcript_16222/m.24509 type:complete len:108 (+) Transcript_16222:256-579(+)